MEIRLLFLLVIFCSFHRLEADENYDNPQAKQVLKFYEEGDDDHFTARNCRYRGSENLPLVLNSLQINPFPIQLGKNIYVNTSFDINQEVGANGKRVEVNLSVRLKTPWGHTELCELVGGQYCHTNNLCPIIEQHKDDCPKVLSPCTCPLSKRSYTVTNMPLKTKKLPIDINGAFDITIKIKEQGKNIGCIESHFCIGKCRPPLMYYPP